ncbi:chromatin-remodelling complex ATPase ISWI2 [Thecamonas trahens ATCC 50062]|uniref:Chromatin-remodelling complex ATPase ISWI2 n=1 Tax=Thecamonas trahens ATCC 50062 TaxID=461836 RepID=A0A0L0DMW8_THETB|nr:chromatin-remodelling complex ATPase ISWI2 [Thecamonas trahens ATCC 50062]KNC53652.1 chromatin-remodelling complex ATPase ISWI2 [Thecamonas trahens ATCC 50062]|eukprot:XP_013761967.1 chromatin-remodelling complex ATPase ISWI2 [Thecamonas trahens ATCC 50062]
MNEFKRWCPSLRVFKLYGAKHERGLLVEKQLLPGHFDVCVTSYEMVNIERAAFSKFEWEYIAIDEAHRIKNESSRLSLNVRAFSSAHRLLITGTPLQNNVHELWALLNFLLPDVFQSASSFDEWFDLSSESAEADAVDQLHKVLRPFLLRRLKADVESSLLPKKELLMKVKLTPMQKEWYRKLLSRDIDALNSTTKATSKTRLLNIIMQLRKCCNHPYLFEGAEPGPPYTTDYHLVKNSGKMLLLDKLLQVLLARDSRALIFSQFTRLLDILEDYLHWRGYEYCRIDGSTNGDLRDEQIEDFNKPGSSKFVFLLSTRAGGLGINLATADTVIIFDSDWNPQMDLQAMDRAHRIGQKKQVIVARFCADNTIEEKIIERAMQKLKLDAKIIQQGRLQPKSKGLSKDEMHSLVRYGADYQFNSGDADEITEADIDAALAAGETNAQELSDKVVELGAPGSTDGFKMESSFATNVFEGVDYTAQAASNLRSDFGGHTFINLGKRRRERTSYNINEYYRETMRSSEATTEKKKKAPRPPKQPFVAEYQFYPDELHELLARELWAWRFENTPKYVDEVIANDEELKTDEDRAARREELREIAVPLTEEEMARRDELLTKGFDNWSRVDFARFYHGCESYGRESYADIARVIETKTEDEVREYAKVFFERGPDHLSSWPKVIDVIEKGEEKLRRHSTKIKLIRQAVAEAPGNPYHSLEIKTKSSMYTAAEDRFIICKINDLGYGEWDKLKLAIRSAWEFRFDWYFKSRTPIELNRRCDALLRAYEKSKGGSSLAPARRRSSKSKASKSKASKSKASKSSKRKRSSTKSQPNSDDEYDNEEDEEEEVVASRSRKRSKR